LAIWPCSLPRFLICRIKDKSNQWVTRANGLLVLSASPEATAATHSLSGELITPATISLEELRALEHETATWADKDGAHAVTRVRLDRLLLRHGFVEGGSAASPKDKHPGWRAVVIASARDGFEAVFSLGELLETLGSTRVLVVRELDGKPLPPKVGPLRLVVLTDRKPSRSLYQLNALRVVNLKHEAR
jgi:DMSO/TMAO reductase YedYZ molybdopterin-dependent catalytic subunit